VRGIPRAVARFWVDLIVGDDRVVVAIVGFALAGTTALAAAGLPAWWLLPSATAVAIGVGVRRAVGPGPASLGAWRPRRRS
jgi:hypothetical protein